MDRKVSAGQEHGGNTPVVAALPLGTDRTCSILARRDGIGTMRGPAGGNGATLRIVGQGMRRATRVHGGVKIPMQVPVHGFP